MLIRITDDFQQRCRRFELIVPDNQESFVNMVKVLIADCVRSRDDSAHREEILVPGNPSLERVWETIRSAPGATVAILAEYYRRPDHNHADVIVFSLEPLPDSHRIEIVVSPRDRGTDVIPVPDEDRSTSTQADPEEAPAGVRVTVRGPHPIPGTPLQWVRIDRTIDNPLIRLKIRGRVEIDGRLGPENPAMEWVIRHQESVQLQINQRIVGPINARFTLEWETDFINGIGELLSGRRPFSLEALRRYMTPKVSLGFVGWSSSEDTQVGLEPASADGTPIFLDVVHRIPMREFVGTRGQRIGDVNIRVSVKINLGLKIEGWVMLLQRVTQIVRSVVAARQLIRPLLELMARYLGARAVAGIAARLGIGLLGGIATFAIGGAIGVAALVTWMHRRQLTRGQIDGLWDQYASGYVLRICLTGRHPDDEHRWWGERFSRRGSQEISVVARRRGIEDAERAISSQGQQQALRALQENFSVNCADPNPGISRFRDYLVAHSSSDPTGRIQQP